MISALVVHTYYDRLRGGFFVLAKRLARDITDMEK
jgi:hypothetical protein